MTRFVPNAGWAAVPALAFLSLSVTAAMPAQDAAPAAVPASSGGVAIEFAPDAGLGQPVPEGKTAADMAEDFITSKGWTKDKETDGFVTAVGSANLSCMPGNKDFQKCRQQAFAEAMLAAKRKLAEYLRAEVSTRLSSIIASGDPVKALKAPPATAGEPQLLDKAKLLLNAELDRRLAGYGKDPSGQPLPVAQVLEEVRASKEFESAIEVTARAELSGLQAYQTFETIGTDKGQIAVVAIHSDKSAQIQAALLGKGPAPAGAKKEPIRKWLAGLGPKVLLYTHGAQPRTNERGEIVLVAFGQSSPISESGLAEDLATSDAQTNAQGALRQFMGEFIDVNKKASVSSTLKEFDKARTDYQTIDTFRQETAAIADKLGMSGMTEVYTWKDKHPSTGKTVYGSVYMWSVSSARNANRMYFDFTKSGGGSGGQGSFALPPASRPGASDGSKQPTGQPSQGAGAPGEEP